MSQLQMLRLVVQQRLTAAAEEIFGVFEKTIEEYEEEIDRQRRLLADVVKDESNKSDTQRLFCYKVEVPSEQQEWSPSLVHEEPEPPQIKEEGDSLWNSQEEEQFLGLEEDADINKFPFISVPVKSDSNEEEAQSLKFHQTQTEETSCLIEQMKTEADGEDCGLSEPTRNLDQDRNLLPPNECDWNQISDEPQSSLDTKENSEISNQRSVVKKLFNCCFCGREFFQRGEIQTHIRIHTEEKPFGCLVCGKGFFQRGPLRRHMRIHTGEKPFICSVCGKGFAEKGDMQTHMRIHTGGKPFSCSVCGKGFSQRGNMRRHMKIHTGEKP